MEEDYAFHIDQSKTLTLELPLHFVDLFAVLIRCIC